MLLTPLGYVTVQWIQSLTSSVTPSLEVGALMLPFSCFGAMSSVETTAILGQSVNLPSTQVLSAFARAMLLRTPHYWQPRCKWGQGS